MIKMKLKDFFPVCLVLTLTLSIAGAENRKRTRHYLHSSRSNAPDSFFHQVPAMRGSHRTPFRPTRIPMAEIGFKTARSEQQFTSDASPDMRPYPDTEDYSSERDYPQNDDYEMNWGINQDYKEERAVIRSTGSFRPHIQLEQYQRERNSIPLRDSRMWPTHVVCNCETNLGGVYALPNEIPTGSFSPYPRPYAQENLVYGEPQTHHGSTSRPHYPPRAKPAGWNPGENDYNHINFRKSIVEETQASKFSKPTIRPKFTTANPISISPTASTKDESPDAVIRIFA